MTNDHSVRSPSTDGESASNTVRAGMREALEFYADPFAWKAKHDPQDVVRVPDFYSETSFGDTAAEALAALQLPETGEIPFADSAGLKSRTAQSEQGGCGDDLAPQGATASINSEANSPAAPEPCAGCGDSGYPCPYCAASAAPCSTCDLPDRVNELSPAPVDAGVREALGRIRQRADGFEQRGMSIFSGNILAEELRSTADEVEAALSSQPVVRVDQKETHGTMPKPRQNI